MYLLVGYVGLHHTRHVLMYNLSTQLIESLPGMRVPRSVFGCIIVENVFGGFNDDASLDKTDILPPIYRSRMKFIMTDGKYQYTGNMQWFEHLVQWWCPEVLLHLFHLPVIYMHWEFRKNWSMRFGRYAPLPNMNKIWLELGNRGRSVR